MRVPIRKDKLSSALSDGDPPPVIAASLWPGVGTSAAVPGLMTVPSLSLFEWLIAEGCRRQIRQGLWAAGSISHGALFG